MRAYICVYKQKNGKNKQVLVLRDGYENTTIEEQVAETDCNFAEVLSCDKILESTVVEMN